MFSAQSLRVQTVVAVIAASSLGYSGCLLDRPVVNVADAYLSLLQPPSIIEDPNLTSPLPGSIIIINQSHPAPTPTSVPFHVQVVSASPRPLVWLIAVDRDRPCGQGCNAGLAPVFEPNAMLDGVSGRQVTISFDVPFAANHCTRVDLYVSNGNDRIDDAFKTGPIPAQTEPIRDGAIVHARWFVVAAAPGSDTLPVLGGPDCYPFGIADGQHPQSTQ